MAPHGATKTSPYELVYGHHAVLPWEMQSDSRRVVLQKDLSSKDYSGLMMDELEDLHMIRLRALENIEKNKLRVAKYYNKKVKVRQFARGFGLESITADWNQIQCIRQMVPKLGRTFSSGQMRAW
jgi:hypothetical protein